MVYLTFIENHLKVFLGHRGPCAKNQIGTGFLKWWYPWRCHGTQQPTMGFSIPKNDGHFGLEIGGTGYHHLPGICRWPSSTWRSVKRSAKDKRRKRLRLTLNEMERHGITNWLPKFILWYIMMIDNQYPYLIILLYILICDSILLIFYHWSTRNIQGCVVLIQWYHSKLIYDSEH